MIGLGQQIAEAFQEAGLERCRDRHFAPDFGRELFGFGLVVFGEVGGGKCRVANAGFGPMIFKKFLDVGRRSALREQCFFHALDHDATLWPKRIVFKKSPVLGCVAVPGLEADPCHQLLPGRVRDGGFEVAKARHIVVGSDHVYRGTDAGDIVGCGGILADGLQGRVKLGDMVFFPLERGRLGAHSDACGGVVLGAG